MTARASAGAVGPAAFPAKRRMPHVSWLAYSLGVMSERPSAVTPSVSPSEDWCGVDTAQIHPHLGVTPAERLRHLTHIASVMMPLQRAARRGR